MTTRTETPYAIHAALLGHSPDFTDAAATLSRTQAATLRREGFGGHGCGSDYDIGVYSGDREEVEALLGRPLTREETTAHEACVRHYLDAAEG